MLLSKAIGTDELVVIGHLNWDLMKVQSNLLPEQIVCLILGIDMGIWVALILQTFAQQVDTHIVKGQFLM